MEEELQKGCVWVEREHELELSAQGAGRREVLGQGCRYRKKPSMAEREGVLPGRQGSKWLSSCVK